MVRRPHSNVNKNSDWQSAFASPRAIIVLVIAAACSFTSATLLGFLHTEATTTVAVRALTFEERVSYQRAIEEVYWQHRIWPKERTDSKPPLETVMSSRRIEEKVRDYLRNSRVLENYGQQPTSPQQVQAEMERIAQHTRDPGMLRELFEALGNDPFVIAECLVRPALSERMVHQLYEMNSKSGARPKQRGQAQLQSPSVIGKSENAREPRAFAGYSLPSLSGKAITCTDDTWSLMTDLPARRANHTAVWTGSEMIVFGGLNYDESLGTSDRYNPATDSWSRANLKNAPIARINPTAVWTGTEMVVWGGYIGDRAGRARTS